MNNPTEKPQIIFQGGPLDSTRPPVHMQVFASYDVDIWARHSGVRPDVGTYIAIASDKGKVVMEWKGV
jgi:hypothetical protein